MSSAQFAEKNSDIITASHMKIFFILPDYSKQTRNLPKEKAVVFHHGCVYFVLIFQLDFLNLFYFASRSFDIRLVISDFCICTSFQAFWICETGFRLFNCSCCFERFTDSTVDHSFFIARKKSTTIP